MAAQQLPVPNAANLQAAVNGMIAEGNAIAQSVQAYNVHQQALNTELSLCANYDVAQIYQQLTAMQANVAAIPAIQASITAIQTNIDAVDARSWNVDAKMENAKLNDATGALIVMRSIDQGANPQVPINQPILTFPATPDALSEMTVQECRDTLRALNKPIPHGPQVDSTHLQTAVRQAIGLQAV